MHTMRLKSRIAIHAVVTALLVTLGWCVKASAQSACSSVEELVLFGAGGRPPGPPQTAPTVGDDPSREGIYEGCLDTKTGRFSLLGIKAKVSRASWLLVDPQKSTVYTTGSTTGNIHDAGTIFAFHIDAASAALGPRGSSPSGGQDPTHLAWDPQSATLFVANHGNGLVGVLKAGADGSIYALSDKALQQGSGPSPRQKNAEPHGLALDPTGHYLLCADFGADKIYVYLFDGTTSTISPSAPAAIPVPAGSGPRHLAFSKDGHFVVLNTELNGQLRVYRWRRTSGTLELAQVVDPYPADFHEEKSAAEIEFSKDGKFFYLSLRGSENKLIVYRWNSGQGRLSEVARVSTGSMPWSFSIDPSGKWLLVTNPTPGQVTVFAVDRATGKLTSKGDPVSLPGAMTVDFLKP